MENLLNKATLISIDNSFGQLQTDPHVPANVERIIERVTTVDLTGIEDQLNALGGDIDHSISKIVYAINNFPAPKITVDVPEAEPPIVSIAPPVVNVAAPVVNVNISWHLVLLASLMPTVAILLDIYMRFKK